MTNLAMRPFCQEEKDLDINFKTYPLPLLVTEIIMTCQDGQSAGFLSQDKVWEMTVGERIEALLDIAALSTSAVFTLVFDCRNELCGQAVEIEFTKNEVSELQSIKEDKAVNVKLGKKEFTFRKPTGRDQFNWLQNAYAGETDAILDMVLSLDIAGNDDRELANLSDDEIAKIAGAIRKADPLIDFVILSECPYCEQDLTCEVDLQALALKRLSDVQIRQLKDIHLLAKHYHWGEQEIRELPAWRRKQYLSFLGQEQGG